MELVQRMLANRAAMGLPPQGGAVAYKKPTPAKAASSQASTAGKTPYQELEALKMEIIEKKLGRKDVKKWLEKLVDYRIAREEQLEKEKEDE